MKPAIFVLAALLAIPIGARAQPAPAVTEHAYALVVGSNLGGAGQEPLRFAERDAAAIERVLVELGGYESERVVRLSGPTGEALGEALDDIAEELRRHRERGEPTQFLFYYSGHARSDAIELGGQRVALSDLRTRILAMPATLSVVVLDACQSGAFSRVKGAEPAADFSYNSVARLTTTGVAVLASSSASELSQESERLGGSYFTHHLLAGLRGAADADRNGRVSLSEAHRYAYDQTLVATSVSAVGRQHVTLETDLRGQGDVALSYPARAEATLELAANLRGSVLVARDSSDAVIAEVQKSPGEPVTLGLPRGRYRIVVRDGSARDARICRIALAPGAQHVLDPGGCEVVRLEETAAKGGVARAAGPRYSIELGAGLRTLTEDGFTSRLADFGYDRDSPLFAGHFVLRGGFRLYEQLELSAEIRNLGGESYTRWADGASSFRYDLATWGLLLGGRLSHRFGSFEPFAEAAVGVTLASDELEQDQMEVSSERHAGFAFEAGAGIAIMPWDHFGLALRSSYVMAPTVENTLGERHDSGGVFTTLSLRTTF